MTKPSGTVVFDRAITIKTKEEIEIFLANPEAYLNKSGALEGLPEFNGFIDEDGQKIDVKEHLNNNILANGEEIVTLGHYGIPYDYPWYCAWIIIA